MGFRRRFRLFLNVVAIVALLVLVKIAIYALRLEFLALDALFSKRRRAASIRAGVVGRRRSVWSRSWVSFVG